MMRNRGRLGHWRSPVGVALAVAMLGIGATGCSDDEGSAGDDSRPPEKGVTYDLDSSTTTQATTPDDGRLTTTTGTVITDFGDRRQRVAAIRALGRVQDDFQAGRMAAACKRINDFMLSQFTPAGTRAETPCPQKLSAYAEARASRGDRTEQWRLLWVRSYTGESGVWVEDADGRRLRIQLSDPLSGDGWQLDLGPIQRPEVLAAELAGADEYGNGH